MGVDNTPSENAEYTKVQVFVEGVGKIFMNKFKRTRKRETEMDYAGHSDEPFQRITKKKSYEWEWEEARDSAKIEKIINDCWAGKSFTQVVMCENLKGEWIVMERLTGCDIPEDSRELGDNDRPKVTIKGDAMKFKLSQNALP